MSSRRDFLKSSGVLIVSFSAASLVDERLFAQGEFGTRAGHVDPKQLDSWIAVSADGRVTAYTGKCELGQGLYTAQMQLVAEELAVPLDRVTLIQCDTGVTPDQGTTSGAQSHPANFNHANLALAAATAREALVRLASARLAVPIDRLTTQNGLVTDRADRAKAVSYGELVGGKTFDLPLDSKAARSHPRDWTVLGTPTPRRPSRHGDRGVRVRAQR